MMAKCGCAGTGCSCQILAGEAIEVSGAGTIINPYIISGERPHVTVTDSDTIDLSLDGAGTGTDPFVLSAEFTGEIPTPDWTPAESRTWSGAVSLTDIDTPRTVRATLTGNVTSVALPTWLSSDSGSITLILAQDATGSRTWPTPGTTAAGADITLTATASARDVVRLFWTGVQWVTTVVALNVS